MSLQEHVPGIASRADKLTFDSKYYTNEPTSTFDCRICLWVFESKWELDIHNSLEHMIINHLEHKGNLEDHPIVQE